ncbi:hypothetical protein PHJA_001690700 [Phtheirospermum japonicum]|uniref:DUF8204 domain-containing protein n=1 Tax=Phtheirospermum japonicum TaxID=374723 RepID=A0A830CGF0_9LAMI|nr:hypothetical protein PHJA_001690700 [Phtheirospermum japonicum]
MANEGTKGEEEKLISSAVMAVSPPNSESISADINSKSEDSIQPKQNDRNACTSSSRKNTNTAEANNVNGFGGKAKSCKGCLYYSSRFKADSRNPLCVGLTRSLPNGLGCRLLISLELGIDCAYACKLQFVFVSSDSFLPQYIVGQSEAEASKEGRNLTEFRYACVGYSLYEDRKGQASSNGQRTQTELPFCIGLEVLVDRRVNTAESASTPAHIHNKGDGNGLPQKRSPKPTNATGEEFLSRQALLCLHMQLNTFWVRVRMSTR